MYYYSLPIVFSLTVTRETLDKLIQGGLNTGLSSKTISTCTDLPPPYDSKDYPQVRFWTAKSFKSYCNAIAGETDGLVTQQKRRGPR